MTRNAAARHVGEALVDLGDYRAVVQEELVSRRGVETVRSEIRRLIDPQSAIDTLHWGRNYLYTANWDDRVVVVKQFRNQSLKARLRRRMRGTKAMRSYRVAEAFLAHGLRTPEPLAAVDSASLKGPAFYICRYLPDVLESRYLLRAMNAGREHDEFPDLDPRTFLVSLARLVRRLHEAGVWFRDMTSGNVLIDRQEQGGEAEPLALYLVDLNRARLGRSPSALERAQDLGRMPILRPEHQQIYLDAYWQGRVTRLRNMTYTLQHRGFLWKNRSKARARGFLRRVGDLVLPRRSPHAHIPEVSTSASRRDRIVWDRLSDQPHQHAGRWQKFLIRVEDAPSHLHGLGLSTLAMAPAARRFLELRRRLPLGNPAWPGIGVGVGPPFGDPIAIARALAALEVSRVLVRVHPWEDLDPAAHDLVSRLVDQKIEVVLALPQNRDLVRDPKRWQSAVGEIAHKVAKEVGQYQIGQAVNRSKWGLWKTADYLDLFVRAGAAVREARPDAELLGPAVIDFEPHATAALLNWDGDGLEFDIVSSLLYVDRRGAPESRQLGLDAVGKALWIKALAETSSNCPSGRSWITEVNWPLWEGPHSPAGRDVSVDEETQARYLSRYALSILGQGVAEQVFWWQLVARGYGLLDPRAEWARQRPAYQALGWLNRRLRDAWSLGQESKNGVRAAHFRVASGRTLWAVWATDGDRHRFDLPAAPTEIHDHLGRAASERTEGSTLAVDGGPLFAELPAGAEG